MELKRCPFCGGEAEYCTEIATFGKQAFVCCKVCAAKGEFFVVSDYICAKDKAIAAWNRRYGDGNL